MPDWQQIWGDAVDLFANTGIQFLDFHIDVNQTRDFSSNFKETIGPGDTKNLIKINDVDIPQGQIFYEYSSRDVIKIYENEWVPLPYFSSDGPNQNAGPFNWVRARLKVNKADAITVQLAVDTTVTKSTHVENYQQPNINDAEVGREFSLSSDFISISKLLKDGCDDPSTFSFEEEDAWVSEWIKANYSRFDASQINLHPESNLEAWASYVAFVEFLAKAAKFPKIKFKRSPYSSANTPKIDVDLVLDIGNSRTCGLILEIPEGGGQHGLGIKNVTQLALRDLSEPSLVYDGLFESRVEFAAVNFGSDLHSRRSGRNNAFLWPSFVRFGPEAVRLMSKDRGNEAFSGLSSPKRYLWDNDLFEHKWRFHNLENDRKIPRNLVAMMPELTARGESYEQLVDEFRKRLRDQRQDRKALDRASDALFSKSSLYGFMIIEIISHAFRQINDAEYRGNKTNKSVPRFLRNVIITLPTATPKQEQSIVKSKVRGAIRLLWSRMAKSGQVIEDSSPNENVEWDEASCTQVMYLYSEIMEKYNKDITTYLKIFGKRRTDASGESKDSFRLACIDIGGGTTDLMVTTFFQEFGEQLTPHQEFREGFRRAGDDLLRAIIEGIIIPKLSNELKLLGKPQEVETILMKCFGKSVAEMTANDEHKRRQFTLKVLAPLALAILKANFASASSICTVRLEDIGDLTAAETIIDYLDLTVQEKLNTDWTIKNFAISFDKIELKSFVDQTFSLIFENVSEVIDQFDVDRVILTGRPSQNSLVIDLFKSCSTHNPNKIVSLSKYKTGTWYPFRSAQNTVGDPKSSVAVGAMLIAVAGSRRLTGLYIPNDKFKMSPTDNYIGKLKAFGRIDARDVFLTPEIDNCDVPMMTDMYIGSRQLDAERWTATPIYKLYFVNVENGDLPFTVKIEKKISTHDDALNEPIGVTTVVDATGRSLRNNVAIKLQTLGENEEYWLDSGAFDV